jgi:nucleoid-associated protein YgaU
MSIEAVSDSRFRDAAMPIAGKWLLRLACAHQFKIQRHVSCGLAVFLTAMGTAHALELGEVAVNSALGQALQVQIPYRLAANEQLAANCVSLAGPINGGDGTPTYTLASRIAVSATDIQVYGSALVREPLLGLNVRIECEGVPHIVRSYLLFIDPPVQTSAAISSSSVSAATNQRVQSAVIVPPIGVGSSRQDTSPRARGQAGVQLTQGQTYRVVRGDTLSGIASRIADRPGTIWQTAGAIFEANRQAFTNNDMDLIEAGRTIDIPVLAGSPSATNALVREETETAVTVVTSEAATSVPVASDLPSSSFGAATPDVTVAARVPSAALPESAGVRVSERLLEPAVLPVEPAAMTTATDAALSGPTEAADKPLPMSVYSLLAIGAGFLLFLSPALIVLRKRRGRADLKFLDISQETASNSEPTEMPASGVSDLLEDGAIHSSNPQLPRVDSQADINSDGAVTATLSVPNFKGLGAEGFLVSEMDPVDLDVGTPRTSDVSVDWFAARRARNVVDESTIMMADVEAELARNQETAEMNTESLRAQRDTQTMTIVELDLLRQDYETELTLTQANSQELRDAVAELTATQAAYAASGENPILEALEREQEVVTKPRAKNKAAKTRARQPRKRAASAKR